VRLIVMTTSTAALQNARADIVVLLSSGVHDERSQERSSQ
jgi:hypothetical protein